LLFPQRGSTEDILGLLGACFPQANADKIIRVKTFESVIYGHSWRPLDVGECER